MVAPQNNMWNTHDRRAFRGCNKLNGIQDQTVASIQSVSHSHNTDIHALVLNMFTEYLLRGLCVHLDTYATHWDSRAVP